jgi:hypothetical protein
MIHYSEAPESLTGAAPQPEAPTVVMLSGRLFMAGCAVVAGGAWLASRAVPLPSGLLAFEVMVTILGLFLFGSFKYQIHKNALTYGMLLIIATTFCGLQTSPWHVEIAERGWWYWTREHLLSFAGLDELLHADTMLFILGLTYFVAVIAQTRLLEGITSFLLQRSRGAILPTIISVTAVVAVASGALGGVSMIGLTIRTLVIVLMLAAAPTAAIRFAVIVCTTVTTICGVFSAYGEPPNLIMKANLEPNLANSFFLAYCGPIAVAAYLVVAWQLRTRLRGQRIDIDAMDVADAHMADVRFLQATKHGEVLTPVELIEGHGEELGEAGDRVIARLREGESLGIALVKENVPERVRYKLLGQFTDDELSESLDRHYVLAVKKDPAGAFKAERAVNKVVDDLALLRRYAQRMGGLAVVPFFGILVLHGIEHRVPLFVASLAAFLFALPGIADIPKMRALALREARQEYAEYYFLFPLFISITLLTKASFFDELQVLIRHGIATLGQAHVAFAQFLGSTLLSAILDNNIVADFASRALGNLDLATLHLFAMSQIAGYALGGCWTHIGSAQSVVAYAFVQRDVDANYTPVQWIKEITPVILQVLVAITVLLYIESALLRWLS